MKNMKKTRTPQKMRLFSFLLMFVLLLSNGLVGTAAQPGTSDLITGIVNLPASALQASFVPAESTIDLHHARLDSMLVMLLTTAKTSLVEALQLADQSGVRRSGERIQVQMHTTPTRLDAARERFTQAGGEITSISKDNTLVQGWLPIQAMEKLASDPQVDYIRIPEQVSLLEQDAGAYTTEGLAVMNGTAWHSAGFMGSGVKIAIIDGGFLGYPSLLGSDLPASVTVKNFVDGENDSQVNGTTEHGVANAEIAFDIAPQASMYLAKIATDLDLQQAIDWVKSNGVDVVSTSIGWYNVTPGDGTGFFANLVQDARNNGIFWSTAAGNNRETHWGGAFVDADGDSYHEFNGTQEVNYFGPGDGSGYAINPGYSFCVYLRWDDWTSVNQDYDLYLLRWNGSSWSTVASSTNLQDGSAGQRPTEGACYTTSGTAAPYGFVIYRYSSTRNVNLEVFTPNFPRLDELLNARSLVNLADAPDAITAAALTVVSPYAQEYYSGEGPTNGPGGTASGGSIKPDISGFANISTVTYGASAFAGTSAATPHVAGAAALVFNAYPAYTPSQVESFLNGRAIDMGVAGLDNAYGYGRLYLGTPPSTNTAPVISGLPDQTLPMNSSLNNAIDLWAYASDNESADSDLTFTINNTLNASAGVSIDSNRYIDIYPAAGWSGQTDVEIKVTDPGALFSTDTFRVTVTSNLKTWTGSVNTDWHTAGNWNPSGVPTASDTVSIPNVTNDPVISSADAAVKDLTIDAGAILDLTTRQLTVEGTLTNNGTLKQTKNVTQGATLNFLRITNQAGTQTKYYGLDFTATSLFNLASQANASQAVTSSDLYPRPDVLPAPLVKYGTGFRAPEMNLSHLAGRPPSQAAIQALPAVFDWRNVSGTNYVTSVKDQANCGSCYAFASVAAFESMLLIDGAGSYDLSENNAKECNWKELNNYSSGGNPWGSCDGGNNVMVANLFSQKGTVLESCDPYQPSDVACNSSCPYQKTLLDWSYISGDVVPDPNVLKQYIYDYGPVETSLYVDETQGFNSSYDGSYTLNYSTPSGSTNHAVTIVGWSNNLPPVPGGSTPATGWIVKNSWGVGWGDNGYFYITYGSGNIGKYASVPREWQNYNASETLLYYDDDGWTGYWGWGDNTAWGLAKFVPSSNTYVKRIEFWTTDATTDVDVYLYDSFNGSTLSGLLASKENLSYGEAGYHSVLLNSPVAVSAGNDVYAVVHWNNNSFGYPIPIDTNGPSETGKTYYSHTGGSGTWFDMGANSYDVAIRIRTSSSITNSVTVSVSGNQFCSGRSSGVKRCYDITTSTPTTATVRFYFNEAERNANVISDLRVFHYSGTWMQEPGTHTSGGSGDAQYVQATYIDEFSPFALDKPATSGLLYLPMLTQYIPPPPPVPNAGFWSGQGVEFYVTTDHQYVHNFAVFIDVQGCGSYKITYLLDAQITNSKFSFGDPNASGSFYASGTFTSNTAANGTGGFNKFNITGCGKITGTFTWSATWQHSLQSSVVSQAVLKLKEGELVFPAIILVPER